MSEQTSNNTILTILLPTYNEAATIQNMLEKIRINIPNNITYEIVIIDDNSPDGTSEIANSYFEKSGNEIKHNVYIRKNERGLSSAVIKGMEIANGKYVLVMDSDFSHPPEMINEMYNEIMNKNLDIVIGSRYVKGGKFEGWPFSRRFMSRLANLIPKFVLGLKVNDSMSGLFLIKKELVDGISFKAIGYKILLEILVKTKGSKIHELPYTCKNRKEGISKFNFSIINDYFILLKILINYKR
ncbi:polyprenol monophosphomannose synthase [Candidatus Nitrosopelagicus sp.]|nr:polyprenol monophosphomannose synthase [Candidatus Nitrosopelagicus sp.]|tara:strand:- start:77 stop:802 length:726 start_codon:yes stop_codon:yes gene_type:complete